MPIEIKVFAKIRPSSSPILQIKNNTISITHQNKKESFNFDKVIRSNDLILQNVNNRQAIFLCYGQSGSGKTSTILGDCVGCKTCSSVIEDSFSSNKNQDSKKFDGSHKKEDKNSYGLLHQILIKNKMLHSDSYFIYNEKIQKEIVRKQTTLNERSSRGHLIIRIECEKRFFTLIDLAGSENNRKTEHSKELMRESCFINKSLFNLNQCMNKIREKTHVPWRGSVLTKKIEECLTQSSEEREFKKNEISQLILLIHLRDDSAHLQETLNTLKFSELSKGIVIKDKIKEKKDDAVWDRLFRGNKALDDKKMEERKVFHKINKIEKKNCKPLKTVSTNQTEEIRHKTVQKISYLNKDKKKVLEDSSNRKMPIRQSKIRRIDHGTDNSDKNCSEQSMLLKDLPIEKKNAHEPSSFPFKRNIDDLVSSFCSNEIIFPSEEKESKNETDSLNGLADIDGNNLTGDLLNSLKQKASDLVNRKEYKKVIEIYKLMKNMGEKTDFMIRETRKKMKETMVENQQSVKKEHNKTKESDPYCFQPSYLLQVLNSSSHYALKNKLKGIGDIKANKIIEYRKYRRIEKLDEMEPVLGKAGYRKMIGH